MQRSNRRRRSYLRQRCDSLLESTRAVITDRFIEQKDLPLLAISLENDEHHKGTTPEFFTELGTVTKVYEDELGPICFVRGAKALRLDIQYVDNNDKKRNMS